MSTEVVVQITDRTVRIADADVVAVPLPGAVAGLPAMALADAVLAALATHNGAQQLVRLVLPSSWCYVHRVTMPQRRPTRDVLAYALEEYLPLDVEQLTCDFLRAADGACIGVAVERARLRPLLDALAARNVTATEISIDVLAGSVLEGDGLWLWPDDEHVAAAVVQGGALQDLRVFRLAPDLTDDEWVQRICAWLEHFDAAAQIMAGAATPQRQERLAQALGKSPVPPASSAASQGRSWPGLDLARNGLAGDAGHRDLLRVWHRLSAVTLVALLAVAIGLIVQHARREAAIRKIAAWEQRLFAEVYPGQAVPAGAALRLASDRRRLDGLTLVAEEASPAPDTLALLRCIVAALPQDVRLDLQEMRLEGNDVTLRGGLRNHQQAEQLAAALGKVPGVQCAAPRTQRLPDGNVQFFLHAQVVAPSSPEATGPSGTAASSGDHHRSGHRADGPKASEERT